MSTPQTPLDLPETPRPGRRVLLRGLLGALAITLFIGVGVATAVVLELKNSINIFRENSTGIAGAESFLDDVEPSGAQTILVLGSDKRYIDGKNGSSRSDSMLLVRLDPSKSATTVMSIPRDLKTAIPGGGTQKINAAYAIGGPKLTTKVLKGLLGTQAHPFLINHVVNINFGGFQKLLNRLGCVYADVDRHYFNDNDPPVDSPTDYATINVKAGYQKLCGNSGLDYVRYRHQDDDITRSARQQSFVTAAKDQIGVDKVFEDRDKLLELFAQNTTSDFDSEDEIISILKLVTNLVGKPVQQVQFPGVEGPSYVELQPDQVRGTVQRFLNAQGTKAAKGKPRASAKKKEKKDRKKEKKQDTVATPGLIAAKAMSQDQALPLATDLRFPVYYPTEMSIGSSYVTGDRRAYILRDRDDKRYQAYRIVVHTPLVGQYYGIQGTTWKDPPILDHPNGEKKMDGRTFKLFGDGKHLRLVSWETPQGVYWVANTLLGTLTNEQMLGIAASTRKFG